MASTVYLSAEQVIDRHAEALRLFERLAAGDVRQEEFFAWVRVNDTVKAARR